MTLSGYKGSYSSGFTSNRADFSSAGHNATCTRKESLWEKLLFSIPDFGFDAERKTETVKNSVSLFISIRGYWIGIWW